MKKEYSKPAIKMVLAELHAPILDISGGIGEGKGPDDVPSMRWGDGLTEQGFTGGF